MPDAGGVLSNVVVAVPVAVHPLAPVTVTLKVPAVLTDIACVAAPVGHKKVPVPFAVKVVLDVVQFNARPLSVMPDAGGVLSNVVVAVPVAVHPLAPVTVTLKVPAVLTVIACVVAPVDQKEVPGPFADKGGLDVVQFNARPLSVMPDAGGVLSNVVVAVPVAVHPLAPVTVTLKVPAVLTVIACVVA